MTEKILQLNREKTIFWVLLSILFLCAGFYMYFINMTVHNVVIRQNLESENSGLTVAISNEEFKYISKRNAITLSLAYSLGFQDSNVKTYITRNQSTRVAILTP